MSSHMSSLHGTTHTTSTPDRPRFLSEADCHDVAKRLARYATGGGYTQVTIVSKWTGNVRWARNLISTSGETRDDHLMVNRVIDGAYNDWVEISDNSDAALVAAVRRAERMVPLRPAIPKYDLIEHYEPEPYTAPDLFFDTTYQLDADRRAEAAHRLAQSAADAGLVSAGYIEVSAHSQALITSYGYTRFYKYTWAQYSVTVRDPRGTGSGWAGVDWPDWTKIDGPKLSQLALDKCLQSRNPVAIEPGRYTTILEPQAVCDFVGQLLTGRWWNGIKYQALDRKGNENSNALPFFDHVDAADPVNGRVGYAKLGQKVVDERITITSDPLDPDLGFPPFPGVNNLLTSVDVLTEVYHPTTWIKDGVLVNLAYDREYAKLMLGRDTGLPKEGAFRMSGGETTIADMIATTKRGLLVTRFDRVQPLPRGATSLLCQGYTRDGLWLIENGKISKAVKNLQFTEAILSALNNVEQLGVPQRAFHPAGHQWWSRPQPAVVPPLKIRDFSFTALTTAI